MSKKATIEHPEMIDSYALYLLGRDRGAHKFQVVVDTRAKIGEIARLNPYDVECLLVPDAATHSKPAVLFSAIDWLRLRGMIELR